MKINAEPKIYYKWLHLITSHYVLNSNGFPFHFVSWRRRRQIPNWSETSSRLKSKVTTILCIFKQLNVRQFKCFCGRKYVGSGLWIFQSFRLTFQKMTINTTNKRIFFPAAALDICSLRIHCRYHSVEICLICFSPSSQSNLISVERLQDLIAF